MQVKIVTEDDVLLLDHSQEGNGHEQIFSRRVASDTKGGQCHFQIIDTGGCLLWIGEYAIKKSFTVYTRCSSKQLQVLLLWPGIISNQFARVFQNPLLSYQIPFCARLDTQSTLTGKEGDGALLLISYSSVYAAEARLPAFSATPHPASGYLVNSSMASAVQHILYHTIHSNYRQRYLRIRTEELYLLLHAESEAAKTKEVIPDSILEKLKTVDQLVRQNPDINYSIKALSTILSINSEQLQRCFKSFYGTTIHQYLLSLKMDAAQQLIRNSDQSIKEISFELGFKSDANFSEAFKNYYGFAPGQLRKKNKGHS